MILFTIYLPMTVCLSGPVTPVWAATGYRPSSPTESMCSLVASTEPNDSDYDIATEPYDSDATIMIDDSETGEIGAPSPSPTESMQSLVASTEPNDSDGDEATERFDDEKTETDSTVSVSASSSGSFDESGVTNSEEAEVGPPSPTHSTASDAMLYDYSEVPKDEPADGPEDQPAETVMALVPCKRYRGHYCFVPVRFFPNPTPEKRKVCHCISTILRKTNS